MSFLEPLFLVGLLAASIPLIVHLINRRKAVRRPFPAMKFLLESNKRVARSIKIRQWVLMALRMLVLALLAFSLAKPFVLSSSGVAAEDRLPAATVFVVDTSFSMSHDDWWGEAKDELDSRIDRLRPWDEAAVVVTDGDGRALVGRLTSDISEIRDVVDDLEPTQELTDLADGLRVAQDLLAASQLPSRRIVVVSDLAKGGFEKEGYQNPGYELEFVRLRDEQNPASVAVSDVAYQQEGSRRERTWRIDATIENLGEDDAPGVQVELLIDGDVVSAGLVDVPAGRTASYTFRHKVKGEGARRSAVRIQSDDELAVDDIRHFAIHLDDRINALLVNGETSSVLYRDELFFFERALNPGSESESAIVPTNTTREGLEGRALDEFDVVMLANVSHVSPATARKLEEFVRGGGGLLISMGDQVDVDAYNQQLGKLLPKKLRGLKQLAEREDSDAPLKVTRFGNGRRQHPIFRVFDDPGGGTLQSSTVYSYMLLEPAPPEQSNTILSYKDAAPALLERSVERGRVMLFTTSVDLEWTDLATRTAYLPLVRRTVQYLARRGTSEGSLENLVGDTVELDVASLASERVVVRGPDDVRVVLAPEDGSVSMVPARAGVYRVWAESDDDDGVRLSGLDFAVNVDISESQLEQIPEETLAAWKVNVSEAGVAKIAGPEKRINLWPFLLFVVTVFLLVESVVGTRRSVLARLGRMLTGRPDPVVTEEEKVG